MEFRKEKWLGNWENFENYIYSESDEMVKTWKHVETVCKSIPALKVMFGGESAREFWKKACMTKTEESSAMLGGMHVEDTKNGIHIRFCDKENNLLGEYTYSLAEVLKHGLEGKENLLFLAEDASNDCPFRYLLSMEPMPDRTTRKERELLSHFHFQFASTREKLIVEEKLVRPMWYATMCEESSKEVEKCNIVRALHRIPVI